MNHHETRRSAGWVAASGPRSRQRAWFSSSFITSHFSPLPRSKQGDWQKESVDQVRGIQSSFVVDSFPSIDGIASPATSAVAQNQSYVSPASMR